MSSQLPGADNTLFDHAGLVTQAPDANVPFVSHRLLFTYTTLLSSQFNTLELQRTAFRRIQHSFQLLPGFAGRRPKGWRPTNTRAKFPFSLKSRRLGMFQCMILLPYRRNREARLIRTSGGICSIGWKKSRTNGCRNDSNLPIGHQGNDGQAI